MNEFTEATQLRYIAPMAPRLRKVGLTAHIASSVGWLGAVAAFLVLSVAGLTSRDAGTVRGAYLAMNLLGQFLIVPLSVIALATGLIQALGTEWGLFRYYWVLVKFTLTMGATLLLVLHQFTAVAAAAQQVSGTAPGALPEIGPLGTQLVGDAGLALLALLAITVLSVYKPWGRTQYSRRKQRDQRGSADLTSIRPVTMAGPDQDPTGNGLPFGLKVFVVVFGVIVVVFAALHHLGGGHGRHGH